jgi:hypothetical protein
MTYTVPAGLARLQARQDLIVFDEITAISRSIIVAMNQGEYQVEISDGTTMTECTPVIVIEGDVQNPVVDENSNINVDGNIIDIGISGTNLAAIIYDINEAGFANIRASKTADNRLSIQYTCTPSDWTTFIGPGDSNIALGLDPIIYTAETPSSVQYYQVWQEASDDRKIAHQLNTVTKHFETLGYVVDILENSQSQNTIKWTIYW